MKIGLLTGVGARGKPASIGRGPIAWPDVLGALHETRYTGPVIYEGPPGAVQESLRALHRARDQTRGGLMRVIVCPACSHENRPSVRASTCDRCGADISLLAGPPSPPPAASPPPVEAPAPAAPTAPAPRPTTTEPRPRGVSADLLGRFVLAILALAAGLYAGLVLRCGSALSVESDGAESVAMLAAAVAISGLVLLLSGSGSGAQRIATGLRLLGLTLALLGTTVVVALLQKRAEETPPSTSSPPTIMLPRYLMPMGRSMYPKGAMQTGPGKGKAPKGQRQGRRRTAATGNQSNVVSGTLQVAVVRGPRSEVQSHEAL